ncbi:hypothetical protein C0J52_06828 [Blattella germanica]|nr:hypothetical protein C0J52_06828 [Blattella germanica]
MFVNIVPRKILPDKLIKMIDAAYVSIDSLAQKYIGIINKVSTFDKDVMFLVIFGLRGFKQESESARALKCAHAVHNMVLRLEDIKSVSVGVTTGMAYCGIVGHTQRKEYTVIGATVNKAARIMCAYPNIITCDQNTYLHSKMPTNLFILQETRELKGIGNVGAIYEYKEQMQ